jgi:hypothetical protein
VLVTTKESAPGGARVRKVTLPPDEALLGHMAEHGVFIDTGVLEEDRLKQAFWIQVGGGAGRSCREVCCRIASSVGTAWLAQLPGMLPWWCNRVGHSLATTCSVHLECCTGRCHYMLHITRVETCMLLLFSCDRCEGSHCCAAGAVSAQVLRYTFPFMFISAVFWLLHTWILDPLPNQFRRREFIRYRCAAGQVSNGTTADMLLVRHPSWELGCSVAIQSIAG